MLNTSLAKWIMRIDIKKLTRSHEWWDHKTPQILSLAYATAILLRVSLFDLLYPGFVVIFVSLIAIAIYASLINDFTDMEIDRACGKSNMLLKLPQPVRVILVLLSMLLVLLAAFYIYPDKYAVFFYLSIAVAISLYSFPPVRLKKRGLWGVLACASAEHLFPALFSISVVFGLAGAQIDPLWLCAAGILSFTYGARSILWHQFLDRGNDQHAGIKTYASMTDAEAFRPWEKVITLIELVALALVLFRLDLIISLLFLGLYLLFIWGRKVFFKSEIIMIITPDRSYYQILMLDFYTIFFPFSLLIYVGITQPLGWYVLLIHILLFYKMLIVTLKDGYYLIRDVRIKLKS